MPAVTVTGNTTSGSDVTVVSTTPFNPGPLALIISFIVVSDYNGIQPTVLSNTVSVSRGWDFIGKFAYRTSLDSVWCFASTRPSVDVGGQVIDATLGSVCTGYISAQAKITGMSRFGRAAIRQFVPLDNQAGGGTPEIIFPNACLAGNPTITHVANGANTASVTTPAGWIVRNNSGHSTPNQGSTWASRDSGFTGTTITWGGVSATDFGILGIELDASPLTADDVPPLVGGWGGTR